ncbi:MAG: hypothetical protein IBJ00_07550, partial [Alphaproteobacteria bacterium]|nr:hypothetical protein [Alphaproteobacteria bacterium]
MPINRLIQLLGLKKAIKDFNQLLNGFKPQPSFSEPNWSSKNFESFQPFKIAEFKDKIHNLTVINEFSDQLFIYAAEILRRDPQNKTLTVNSCHGITTATLNDSGWQDLKEIKPLPKGICSKKGYNAYYHQYSGALVY